MSYGFEKRASTGLHVQLLSQCPAWSSSVEKHGEPKEGRSDEDQGSSALSLGWCGWRQVPAVWWEMGDPEAVSLAGGRGWSPGRAGFTVCDSSTEGPARAGHMKAFALRPFSFGCFEPLFSIALFKLVFNLLFSL